MTAPFDPVSAALGAAQLYLELDLPIPVDLQARLAELGVDISTLS